MAGPSFKLGQYEKLSKSQKMIYWIAIVVGFAVIGGVWLLNFFDVWDANPAATGFVVY
ncbi:hypothetical protein SAMN05444172_1899 [Burkholderia sp. GAS332]|jgi:hypothetical protein|uniref:hypothetical protein n=1 Tax=Paraburkholderia sediminicola TaxID=458836 RepID=UPI000925B8CD|nr:hypothetical protein SAMN05444172_1899 [Burkholderia sp. GAS332]